MYLVVESYDFYVSEDTWSYVHCLVVRNVYIFVFMTVGDPVSYTHLEKQSEMIAGMKGAIIININKIQC